MHIHEAKYWEIGHLTEERLSKNRLIGWMKSKLTTYFFRHKRHRGAARQHPASSMRTAADRNIISWTEQVFAVPIRISIFQFGFLLVSATEPTEATAISLFVMIDF